MLQHKLFCSSIMSKGRKFYGTIPSFSFRCFHKTNNTNDKIVHERMEAVNQNFDEVVARMKLFEGQYDSKVNFDIADQQPIVMRFDGFHFKSFTTNGDIFEKPFDANIHWALLLAVRDLCLKNLSMNPTLIYNCSDELTLLFSGQTSNNEKQKVPNGIYRGRAQKLVSISTSFLTITFNYYLRKLLRANADSFESRLEYDMHNSNISKKSYQTEDFEKRRLVRQKLLDGDIFGNFDCRIYQLPTISHAIDYMIWRQIDCIRNSKTTLGSKFYAQNEMNFLSASKIVEMVEQEKVHLLNMIIPLRIDGDVLDRAIRLV
ncbi:predicted protein [Naegleria gruberi]|uniref:Predicted protein n=1 Tax=Naegleria gruberi TaxID=5762 RepID=D2UXG3_NAEGR|nr:uncharacterized protein NAEGRDRAFT_61112 [Naegleria gruberi]EFC50628.1 predicted protein [Naegleria gruberi]|eukprot:XP_002683372.1 predicted protein [Naegleria gruberi strain NEG-M]